MNETGCIRFDAGKEGGKPVRDSLSVDDSEALLGVKRRGLPVAYVVNKEHLPALLGFSDIFVDRRRKNPAKGLSGYLLGREKIPAIEARYESTSQLGRSIRTLLDNALDAHDRNIYVIGTGKSVFERLWLKAEDGAAKELEPDDEEELSWEPNPNEPVDEDLKKKFLGESAAVRQVRVLVMRAAESDSPVLIIGETGTGKEIVAREIHRLSKKRCAQKLVVVNCAAIPREMFESELFGHKKGAFTGATRDKPGLVEDADTGTLFLDEIGDLAPEHQGKMLRYMEDGTFRRVGCNVDRRSDARIIAATNRELAPGSDGDSFREDLYWRLRKTLVRTPSLDDSDEDLGIIAKAVWRRITRNPDAVLSDGFLDAMRRYTWTGNVRQVGAILGSIFTASRTKKPEAKHLEWAMNQECPPKRKNRTPKSDAEIWRHRTDCLKHLRAADEVVRAVKVSFRRFGEEGRRDRRTVRALLSAIRLHSEELEILCLHPCLFHNEAAFSVVVGLKGKIWRMRELLKDDVASAVSYWSKEFCPVSVRIRTWEEVTSSSVLFSGVVFASERAGQSRLCRSIADTALGRFSPKLPYSTRGTGAQHPLSRDLLRMQVSPQAEPLPDARYARGGLADGVVVHLEVYCRQHHIG